MDEGLVQTLAVMDEPLTVELVRPAHCCEGDGCWGDMTLRPWKAASGALVSAYSQAVLNEGDGLHVQLLLGAWADNPTVFKQTEGPNLSRLGEFLHLKHGSSITVRVHVAAGDGTCAKVVDYLQKEQFSQWSHGSNVLALHCFEACGDDFQSGCKEGALKNGRHRVATM